MIDRDVKRVIGQMTYGVYVVACRSGSLVRGYSSTWTGQVSFADPVISISVSPKHDTYALIDREGWFTVSILAGDQIEEGQYFSYPGRRFEHLGDYFDDADGAPVIKGCVAWMRAVVFDRVTIRDHVVMFADVVEVGEGRLDEPALTYSSRKGWRIADTAARAPGESIRDGLIARLEAHHDGSGEADG